MPIHWDALGQQATVSVWLYIVNGAIEGLGVNPVQAVNDAFLRAQDEFESVLYNTASAEETTPSDGASVDEAEEELEPEGIPTGSPWFDSLHKGTFVHLSTSSVGATTEAILGWADPNEVDYLGWMESLERWLESSRAALSQPLASPQEV